MGGYKQSLIRSRMAEGWREGPVGGIALEKIAEVHLFYKYMSSCFLFSFKCIRLFNKYLLNIYSMVSQ